MKKFLLIAAAVMAGAFAASAGHIKVTGATPGARYTLAEFKIEDFRTIDSNGTPLNAENGEFDAAGAMDFETVADGPRVYALVNYADDSYVPLLLLNPADDAALTYSAGSPYPAVSGPEITEAVNAARTEQMKRWNDLQTRRKTLSEPEFRTAYEGFFSAMEQLLAQNLGNAGAVYLLQYSSAPVADKYIDKIKPQAYGNMMRPLYDDMKQAVGTYRQRMAAQQAVGEGKPAPDFTLTRADGSQFTLGSLRGKWVILDFWGAWCGWCIKGFPELKEAYNELKGKGLEIVGIDCGDTDAAWRAALEKYELPWINVRQAGKSGPSVSYGVSGFPTKLIIDPEGNIRNVTTGHRPEFFQRLRELMGE